MKKKALIVTFGTLALSTFVCGLAACGEDKKDAAPAENEYGLVYRSDWQGENDADMEIDGSLEEDRWQNKKWYTTCAPYGAVNDSVWMKTTAFTTKYGLYIGAVLYDDNIVGDGEFNVTQGTCLEYHYTFRKQDGKLYNASYADRGRFFLDVFGNYCTKGERMKRGVRVDGVVNSGETKSATFEVFVPWEQTGVKVTEDWYPDKAYVLPGCRVISEGQAYSLCTLGMVSERWRRDYQAMYYEFDENGYTKADEEGAVLGDAKNGFAKSAGWNLDKLSEGEVSLDKTYEYDYIFFRNAFANNFEASMTIYPGEYLYDTENGIEYDTNGLAKYKDGRSGFYLLSTTGQEFVPYLEYNDLVESGTQGVKVPTRYHLRSLDNFVSAWHLSEVSDIENTEKSGAVKFSMIKYGADLFYFADGNYLGTQRVSSLNGGVYVGLYNCNRAATYKNYTFDEYTEDEVKARLSENEIHPVNASAQSGGKIECGQTWVKKGETLTFKAVCESGYTVDTIKLGGTDITANCNVQPYGKYYVTVADSAEIAVSFKANTEALSAITGKVYSGNDEKASAATLQFASLSNNALYSTRATSANGYNIALPNGEYLVFVTFGTKSGATQKITVMGNGTHDIRSAPLNVETGNIKLNDEGNFSTVYSDTNNRAYFETIDAGESFVLETTLKDIGSKSDPSAGVILSKGGKHWVRFVIRNLGDHCDFVIWRDLYGIDGKATPDYFGKVIALPESVSDPFAGGTANLKLVYNNGRYFIFVNDTLIAEASENEKYDNGNTIAGALGAGQKLSLGIFAERDVTFIAWDRAIGRDSVSIKEAIGTTLTVPSGAEMKVNGETVTGNDILLGDEVTVSMEQTNGTFKLDGNMIVTEMIDGKSVAKFTVTGEHQITYSVAYTVTGTVTNGNAETEVTIVGENGTVAYTGKTDGNGNYTASLSDGKYYVYAQNGAQITNVESVTVNGAAATFNAIAFEKPIIDAWATNNEYTIDYKTGDYCSLADQNQNGGWFAGIEVNPNSYYVLEATVKDMTTDKIKNKFPSAGLMVGTQTNWLRFTVQRLDESDEYRFVLWYSGGNDAPVNISGNPFEKGSMNVKLVYANGTYYFYVNEVQVSTSTRSIGEGTTRVGLFNDWQITFTDWGYTSGRDSVASYLEKELTVAEGVEVQINGESASVTGGKVNVLLGDKITVSVAAQEGKTFNILLDNGSIETTQDNGKAVASFTVTNDHSVSYSVAYTVTGTVTGGDEKTVVTIVGENGAVAYTGNAKDGSFATTLSNGKYYVYAQNATHITNVITFTVDNVAYAITQSLTFDRAALNAEVGKFTFDYKTGNYTTAQSDTNNRAYFKEIGKGEAFTLEASMKGMGAGSQWPCAGFILSTGGDNWIKFVVRHNPDISGFDIVVWRNIEGDLYCATVAQFPNDAMKQNPFTEEGGTLRFKLSYAVGTYMLSVNDILIFQIGENSRIQSDKDHTIASILGEGNVKLGLFAERQITFTDWSYEKGYTVTGSIAGGDSATVITVANDLGVIYTGNASEDGSFTVNLTNGTYYVSAQSATQITNVTPIIVNGVTTVGEITFAKPLIDAWLTGNQYTIDYKTGSYCSAPEQNQNGGWFAGISVQNTSSYTLEAMVKDMPTPTDQYPSAGFMVGTSSRWLRFTVQYNKDNGTYRFVLWRSYDGPIVGQNVAAPFASGSMNIKLVYANGTYTFSVNDMEVYTTNIESVNEGENLVGLFNDWQITFTDWKYTANV